MNEHSKFIKSVAQDPPPHRLMPDGSRSMDSALLLALVLMGRACCGDRNSSGQLWAAAAPAEIGDGVALYRQGQAAPVAWQGFYRSDLPPQYCQYLHWIGSVVDEISWPCILHNEEQNLRCVRSQLLEDTLFHKLSLSQTPGLVLPPQRLNLRSLFATPPSPADRTRQQRLADLLSIPSWSPRLLLAIRDILGEDSPDLAELRQRSFNAHLQSVSDVFFRFQSPEMPQLQAWNEPAHFEPALDEIEREVALWVPELPTLASAFSLEIARIRASHKKSPENF